jgi:FemAB-related protein (PEP-CTERM system-associated)
VTSGPQLRHGEADDDAQRDEYVTRHPSGTFFHLAGWSRAVHRSFGHRRLDLLAFDGDRITGVLPMMACRGLRGGTSLISMPYAVYGGPIADDEATKRALFERAEAIALERRVGRLELRSREDPGLELPKSELYSTFIRDLPATPEGILAAMPKKSRAEARKARDRHGLELSLGDWFLPDLLRLFHQNKRNLGSPALPERWFRILMAEFPGQVTVHLVRKGDRPLAAVMSFLFRDELLAYYSGTAEGADREASASNFMYFALQQWAVEQGFARFDFGRSRKNAGAFRFKVHQGFEPRDLHYSFRLVRDRGLPSLNPSNPKTKILQDNWRRLPLWLTERLSGSLARFLP